MVRVGRAAVSAKWRPHWRASANEPNGTSSACHESEGRPAYNREEAARYKQVGRWCSECKWWNGERV